MEALGQCPGRMEAVALHLRRAAAQQPRGFQRVRGERGGALVGGALAQAALQRRVGGQGIEGISVQHQPGRLRQHPGQHRLHRLAAATAADHGGTGQVQCFGGTQHQFGLAGYQRVG